jgi:CheY-like chemotaxis protein
VTVFGNSSDALEMVRATPQRYDLVITDHAMPKMTGLEMVKEMQKIRKDIPVILVTGVLDAKIEKQIDDLGIRICLEKPVFKHVLAASVRKALDGNYT